MQTMLSPTEIRANEAAKGVTMKGKRVKDAAVLIPVVSGSDRDVLAAAYKGGLILGWKADSERGYRLTLANRRDDYVETAKLATYVEKLRKEAPLTS